MDKEARSKGDYYNPKPTNSSEAMEQLVLANRILPNEGIMDYLGHVSARNPENPQTFFISRSLAPEQVTKMDLLECDFEGNILTDTKEKPYSERIIHCRIYKARPDVQCVIHAHPHPLITLSVLAFPVRILFHPATLFYEGVPVYDGYDFKSPGSSGMIVRKKEEGDRVAQTLGKARGMLMRGHGCNVVGESIPRAVQAVIALRDNVAIQLAAQQLGETKSLTYEEAKVACEALAEPKRPWNYWVARVKRAMPDLDEIRG